MTTLRATIDTHASRKPHIKLRRPHNPRHVRFALLQRKAWSKGARIGHTVTAPETIYILTDELTPGRDPPELGHSSWRNAAQSARTA